MDLTINKELLYFAKTIVGAYNNKLQAQKKPKDFAHINFYFRPIPWSILKAPGLYSEQSYDYDPWSPYRQNVNKIILKDNYIIVENYFLKNRNRIAGAGKQPHLLNEINNNLMELKLGCSMHFKKINFEKYIGFIEPGNKCIIANSGKPSYLISKVSISDKKWISEEGGCDNITHKQIWGSANGPFVFNKVISFENDIYKYWLDKDKKIE